MRPQKTTRRPESGGIRNTRKTKKPRTRGPNVKKRGRGTAPYAHFPAQNAVSLRQEISVFAERNSFLAAKKRDAPCKAAEIRKEKRKNTGREHAFSARRGGADDKNGVTKRQRPAVRGLHPDPPRAPAAARRAAKWKPTGRKGGIPPSPHPQNTPASRSVPSGGREYAILAHRP